MTENILEDIHANFERALNGFYESAATGISTYVIPIAWVLLGVCMLVWCFLVVEGKVVAPATDWILKFVGFMVVLYLLGSGYLSWVAKPIFDLPSELISAVIGSPLSAQSLLGQVNDKVLDLVSAIFIAGSRLLGDLAIGPAVTLLLMGVLVVITAYLLLSVALFATVFAKLGLSLVLAVGPLFFLSLILPQTRSYFRSWLNTALYFVLYHVLTTIFIFLFIGIIDAYLSKLNSQLVSVGAGGGMPAMVSNLIGVGGAGLNVAAVCIPIILISMAMFFVFLQIPTICASLTGGSGGSFGAGLSGFSNAKSLLGRSKGG